MNTERLQHGWTNEAWELETCMPTSRTTILTKTEKTQGKTEKKQSIRSIQINIWVHTCLPAPGVENRDKQEQEKEEIFGS